MIFVTGGTGLIGSHLLYEMCSRGEKVRALKRPSGNTSALLKVFSYYTTDPESLFSTIDWVDGDLSDCAGLEMLLKDVDEVYHCAAIVSFRSSERGKMIANNVEITANMVNAAINARVKRFCHVSSVAALGKVRDGSVITEEIAWMPSKKNSGYAESKFHSEMEVWRGIEEGLKAVIVNPSIVIGPGDWNRSSPRLFTTVWNGLKFYTKGSTGFIGVKDVIRAMLTLMEPQNFAVHKNQRFLLSSHTLGYRDFFGRVARALGKPEPSIYASGFMQGVAWRGALLASFFTGKEPFITKEAVSGSNREIRFDGSKITRETGFQYGNIDDAIKETAKCFIADHRGLN
jgi:dihydroflavonol-4-reductase